MSAQSALRDALDQSDASRCFDLWRVCFPNHPQPRNLAEAEVAMHIARTASEAMRIEARLYSHAWLTERAQRSQLPKHLWPPAERNDSVIVPAVGIAVGSLGRSPERRERAKAIEAAMAQAAGEMVDAGILDRDRIVARMWEARNLFLAGKLKVSI